MDFLIQKLNPNIYLYLDFTNVLVGADKLANGPSVVLSHFLTRRDVRR